MIDQINEFLERVVDPVKAFKAQKIVVITGMPGSGKTYVASRLGVKSADAFGTHNEGKFIIPWDNLPSLLKIKPSIDSLSVEGYIGTEDARVWSILEALVIVLRQPDEMAETYKRRASAKFIPKTMRDAFQALSEHVPKLAAKQFALLDYYIRKCDEYSIPYLIVYNNIEDGRSDSTNRDAGWHKS